LPFERDFVPSSDEGEIEEVEEVHARIIKERSGTLPHRRTQLAVASL
jgi:hypothetical protein